MTIERRGEPTLRFLGAASLLLSVVALAACGGTNGGRDAAVRGDAAATDTPVADAPVATDAASNAPNISVALDCGRGGGGTGPGPANADAMQRATVDVAAFPDALCNDGSPAVVYFRPYRGEVNRNRWVINLRGGGGCGDGQSCAARWCGCTGMRVCPATPDTTYTNFDRGNMVSEGAASQNASGIFLRNPPSPLTNPIGDYNQVRVIYCSSDNWTGTRRAVPFNAIHPVSGAAVSYSIHFLGSRILDAALATLRQDGGRVGPYTLGGANTPLPDLDDAAEVIVAGDSAGGAGVINNLDRIAAGLRARNTACTPGGACPLVVRGLIDAIVGPDHSRLTLSPTGRLGSLGVTTYAAYTAAVAQRRDATYGALRDESCRPWHTAQRPGTEDECSDEMHIVRHHLTTPFFVRMALRDALISGNYYEDGWVDPMLGLFDSNASVFARVLQPELDAFPMMRALADERDAIATAPGVFAPLCTNHDTINTDSEVFGVTITPMGGPSRRLLDVFEAWRRGAMRVDTAVLSDPRANVTNCP